ncbi:MAG: hypothetical protein WBL35_02525 [Ornithinibacter sp.]
MFSGSVGFSSTVSLAPLAISTSDSARDRRARVTSGERSTPGSATHNGSTPSLTPKWRFSVAGSRPCRRPRSRAPAPGGNGEFSVSENHGSDRRQFRVKVCYDDGRLRVKEGQETSILLGGNGFPIDIQVDLTDKDWYEIHNDKTAEPDGRRAGTHDLGTLRMSTRRSRQLGDIWTLLSMTLDRLEGMGEDFGKSGTSVVKFPMGTPGATSAHR